MVVVLCVTSVLLSLSDTLVVVVCDICVAVIVRHSVYCFVCDNCFVVIVRHSVCCLVCDVCVAVIVRHSVYCFVCDNCFVVIVRHSVYCLVCDVCVALQENWEFKLASPLLMWHCLTSVDVTCKFPPSSSQLCHFGATFQVSSHPVVEFQAAIGTTAYSQDVVMFHKVIQTYQVFRYITLHCI